MKLSTEQIKTLKKLTILAGKKGNLPNAAIIIDNDGNIIGQSQSLVATSKDATAHAERLVIEKVCKANKSCVIPQYKLISVFEPCLMCLSASFWAGVKEVYYIIPASKYWNEIPWISESKKINKQDLIAKFSEEIRFIHLRSYEKDFVNIAKHF